MEYLVSVVFTLLFRTLVIEYFTVPSESMLPNIQPRQLVAVEKAAYGMHLPGIDVAIDQWAVPRRGDVVVFADPRAESAGDRKRYLKRVVALPGERVSMKDVRLYIDGERMPSAFLPTTAGLRCNGMTLEERDGDRTWRVKTCLDAADCGPCETAFDEVLVPPGHVFVLGDNRGESMDSRHFGPVPVSYVLGRVAIGPQAH
jgi:signal peptidase I